MMKDCGNCTPETPLSQDAEPPRGILANILDALDMDGAGEIDIAFEQPLNHLHSATFDRSIDRPDSTAIGRGRDNRGRYDLLAGCHAGPGPRGMPRNDVEVVKSINGAMTIGKGEGHTPRYV